MTTQPDEYEELDCPKENTFKVGDLVLTYAGDSKFSRERTIEFVDHDFIYFKDKRPGDHHGIHYKACRPLKKKEPPKIREFWILVDHEKVIRSATYPFVVDVPDEAGSTISSFKVQDRCHKCGEDFNK